MRMSHIGLAVIALACVAVTSRLQAQDVEGASTVPNDTADSSNPRTNHASSDASAVSGPGSTNLERQRGLLREQLELEPVAAKYPRLVALQAIYGAVAITGLVFVLVADKNLDDGENSFVSGPFFGSGCGGPFSDCVWSPGMYSGAVMVGAGLVGGLLAAILALKPGRARARLREIDRELRGLRLEVSTTGLSLRF